MNPKIYFSVIFLSLFSLGIVIIVDGRRSLWYTNSFEFSVDGCHDDGNGNTTIKKFVRNRCCQEFCKANTKCYFGISKDYIYPNGTEEDVCLCYTCRPKERFVVQNRFSSYEIVMVDFPYCTILLPSRANELCRGYCNGGEKCGDGGCAINSKNETADRCICQKCPLHDESFLPVFDFMF